LKFFQFLLASLILNIFPSLIFASPCPQGNVNNQQAFVSSDWAAAYKEPSLLSQRAIRFIRNGQELIRLCETGDWTLIEIKSPDNREIELGKAEPKSPHCKAFCDAEPIPATGQGWILTKFISDDPIFKFESSSNISFEVFTPYDADQYPTLLQSYGTRLLEINEFRIKAARAALASGKCDYVKSADLGTTKSTPDELHFWVDCRNGERIWLNEKDLNGQLIDDGIRTKRESGWAESQARKTCKTLRSRYKS